MANQPCNGCGMNPPTIPFQYPYNRPARDSYGFCPCPPDPPHQKHPGPKPNPHHFPTAGSFIGSGFSLVETYPYLVDTTTLQYGQILCYSEAVNTKVTRRNDASCINLAATFDLTDTNLNNIVLNDFLNKYIAKHYVTLEGVLPIIKDLLTFKIYYTITDYDGGVVHTGVITRATRNSCFHFTDIKDTYVTSAHDLVMQDIPAMTYAGLYTITLDKIELYVEVLDTKQHLQDIMNPYYQFIDNNLKIQLQHDLINAGPVDGTIKIAETPINVSIDYKANVTNRLKLSFTAFMSTLIAAPDTLGVYNALFEPTEEIINQLRRQLALAEEAIGELQTVCNDQQNQINDLTGQVTLNKNNIASLTSRVAYLENKTGGYDSLIQDLLDRVSALENRPLALVSYIEGRQFVVPQLTWKKHGQLYQVDKNFTASGDFEADVAAGKLIPIVADEQDISALVAEIETVSGVANDANSLATQTAATVDTMSETVSGLSTDVSTMSETVTGLNETVGTMSETVGTMGETVGTLSESVTALEGTIETLEGDVDTLQEDVQELKDKELEKNKVVIKNLTTGAKQYVNSYGAAATIIKEDLEGSYKVYPGEGYEQITLSADTFKNVTSLKEIEFPTTMTTFGNYVFQGSGLTSLTIPDHFTTSGTQICENCVDLETLVIDAPNFPIGEQSFAGCTKLTHPTLTAVKQIKAACFMRSGVVEVEVPSTCELIGAGAFSNTASLSEVTLRCADVQQGAFQGSAVKTVNMDYHVSTVHSSSFAGCDGITFNIHALEGGISNSPWGCTNATLNWHSFE